MVDQKSSRVEQTETPLQETVVGEVMRQKVKLKTLVRLGKWPQATSPGHKSNPKTYWAAADATYSVSPMLQSNGWVCSAHAGVPEAPEKSQHDRLSIACSGLV